MSFFFPSRTEAENTSSVIAAEARLAPGAAETELLTLRRRHPGLTIQLLTLEEIPGNRTISMIGRQTLRAAKTGALLAARPEVDLLLRLAGTTQIAVAIEKVGYKAKGKLLLVAAGPAGSVARLRKELVGDASYKVIEGEEIENDGLAMVERAALLGTRS
ncbi:MAG: KEOPS complex subunit Cgi121 [Nitrososphaerales archaeon]